MELELGLALIPSINSSPTKGLGFDLNGDARPATAAVHKRKRGFTDAFGSNYDAGPATLPLFVWQSAHDSDASNGDGGSAAKSAYNGGTAPVGWPPVKSAWRGGGTACRYVKVKMEGVAIGRKVDLSLHSSYATLLDALDRLFTRDHGEEGGQLRLGGDGPPLPPSASRHPRMFTYQDGDGDWMLLGDVPWETFVKSAKRLKIFSCSE